MANGTSVNACAGVRCECIWMSVVFFLMSLEVMETFMARIIFIFFGYRAAVICAVNFDQRQGYLTKLICLNFR